MALEGYKSNNNVVYSSKYHCVGTPKYRRSVLVGPIAKRCAQVMRQTAKKYRVEIIALEIMPDHVHLVQSHRSHHSFTETRMVFPSPPCGATPIDEVMLGNQHPSLYFFAH
jgi:REP element-mobilizing transposase RayT